MTSTSDHKTVAIIGVGLMGGSLGLAAQALAGVREVRGFGHRRATMALALERGAVTRACETLEEAVDGADLVFVCTPVRMVVEHVRRALAASGTEAVVSDVGSTKGTLMASLTESEQQRCIGGHPLCGSETAGVANARASLYEGATYFLTPGAHVRPEAFKTLYDFLVQIGAEPVAVDPDEHDRVLALVSHLPHVLANALMTQAGEQAGGRDPLLCAGPSFRDMTRISGSNRRVWTDIFLENRAALLAALRDFRGRVDEIASALENGDEEAIGETIARAATQRERFLEFESLAADRLFRVMVRIPDRPGVLQQITVALGDANINIEDLAMHHMSADLGGTLTVYVLGADVCERTTALLADLGYQVTAGEGRRVTVVAIDGPAGSGKSTLARLLAERLGYVHLDTGAMYRAITFLALQDGVALDDAVGLAVLARSARLSFVAGRMQARDRDVSEEIRRPAVSAAVSEVSAHAEVRDVLVAEQRRLAGENDVVMEGRDIGTVVFPEAPVKIFLRASSDVRAERRRKELIAKGEHVDAGGTLAAINARDAYDSGRAVAPLRAAADAVELDSSGLTIEAMVDAAAAIVARRLEAASR